MDQIEQVVQLQGIVHSTPDFTGQGGAIDGCNELLVEVLGEKRGSCVRTCFGVNALCAAVTVDMRVRLKPGATTQGD